MHTKKDNTHCILKEITYTAVWNSREKIGIQNLKKNKIKEGKKKEKVGLKWHIRGTFKFVAFYI